ncbi:MAG: nucleoside recognition domain-containing protein [Eubacteriales bacterium]|jgi:spore maturation protein A|nr:nucleoside recognition domain-containing protein [Eubacteriales bacterium]
MINKFWLFFIIFGMIVAAATGNMGKLTQVIIDNAQRGVSISLGLVAILTFWLGMMKIIEKSGLSAILVKALGPLVRFLFPSVPRDHPAMSSILMTMSADMLGMGSAATPIGLKAMKQLQELNPDKETASPAMCTFLAMNTSSITLIPTTIIALRAASGSLNPSMIIPTALVATCASFTTALCLDLLFRYFHTRREQKND